MTRPDQLGDNLDLPYVPEFGGSSYLDHSSNLASKLVWRVFASLNRSLDASVVGGLWYELNRELDFNDSEDI